MTIYQLEERIAKLTEQYVKKCHNYPFDTVMDGILAEGFFEAFQEEIQKIFDEYNKQNGN